MKNLFSKIALAVGLSALIVSGSVVSSINKPARALTPPDGDLLGAARITMKQSSDEDLMVSFVLNAGYATKTTAYASYSGAGLYLRVKNYTATDTYVNMVMKAQSGAQQGPKSDVKQTSCSVS